MDNSIGWGSAAKVPGQVPRRNRTRPKFTLTPARGTPEPIDGEQPAKPFRASMLLEHTEPRLTVDSILDGLGLDPAQLNAWRIFLEETLHQTNDVVIRQSLHQRMQSEEMIPELRKVIWERSRSYLKNLMKSLTEVYPIEQLAKALMRVPQDLSKAAARGGDYHRRVPTGNGKYRYYYDEEKYTRSKDAHVDGSGAAKSHINKTVQKKLDKAGSEGCPIDDLKALVGRYGSKVVGSCLNDMRASGALTFKAGKLYINKKSEPSGSGDKQ